MILDPRAICRHIRDTCNICWVLALDGIDLARGAFHVDKYTKGVANGRSYISDIEELHRVLGQKAGTVVNVVYRPNN